ncbi:hypothetical protein [Microvirga vignae]|uniref:hypothetical protein n=1 Tax=Microvirga vignae TaxID=1225564 RepID=UPI00069B25E5|nr:hypothetical protein [Microvirga vignae]
MLDSAQFLKSSFASLSSDEALRQPVTVLLGVPAPAQAPLEAIGVQSVFDLAASRIFTTAGRLLALQRDPTMAEVRLNAIATDAVDAPPGVPVTELADRPIEILRGIGTDNAEAVSGALDVVTVRDLALWPPYGAAKTLLDLAFFPEKEPDFDPDAPADLLPKSGIYPTERVFYRKLVLDAVGAPGETPQPIETAAAIDLGAALTMPLAFQRLAIGAELTFSQSWFAQGLTLGQLLHSTSLAPGESTLIAMIDWERRTRASASETISETEQLTNTMTHSRAVSEVTDASAWEFQTGKSKVTTTSTTGQGGVGFGLDLGLVSIGGSGAVATSSTEATSVSSSYGQRELAASYAQQINDLSQQNASAVRNRRASIVREVSQEEHEQISTRVVTNYNHMHALSIQYYEVVQAFRVTTQLERARKCLFVPLQLISFHDPAVIDRWRLVLANAALTQRAQRQLTVEYGVVEIIPQTPRVTPGRLILTGPRPSVMMRRAANAPASTSAAGAATPDTAEGTPAPDGSTAADGSRPDYRAAPVNTPTAVLAAKGWNVDQLSAIGWATGRLLGRSGSDSVFVSDDTLVLGFNLKEGQAARFSVRRRDGAEVTPGHSSPTAFAFAGPIPITELQSIAIQTTEDRDVATALVLQLNVLGTVFPLDVPVVLRGGSLLDVVNFGGIGAARELTDHLEANRLHYSQAIYRALDAASIGAILAPYTYRGLPLGQVIDPQPVAVTANFLVFRLSVSSEGHTRDARWAEEETAWREWLVEHGLDRPAPKTELIPLPSGGVFAEAVLGRFNAAEKIDLTRFWNWQDSPIPITAPEIAPVQAGSRAQPEDLRPGQLSQPIVSIQAPTSLPEPTGVSAIVSAIQQGNMFRDMSGLAQASELARAALEASARGATAVGDQAAQNLKTVMDARTERMRIAAQLAAQSMGMPAGGNGAAAPGRNTVSERGGELNMAKSIDAEGAQNGAGGLGAGGPSADAGESSSVDEGDLGSGSDGAEPFDGLTELQRTFRAQREGPGGDLTVPLVRTILSDVDSPDDGSSSGNLAAQIFRPKRKPQAATPRKRGSPHEDFSLRFIVSSQGAARGEHGHLPDGWIFYRIRDAEGTMLPITSEGWVRLSGDRHGNFIQSKRFTFPVKNTIYIQLFLVPVYKAEIENTDLFNQDYIKGIYKGEINYVKGASVYNVDIMATTKSMRALAPRWINFDDILQEKGISRHVVFDVSATNTPESGGNTVEYIFKYYDVDQPLDVFKPYKFAD